MTSQSSGSSTIARLRLKLKALLIGCVMLVSLYGCASQTPLSPQSQVVVDASLMAPPNYTQTLLDFLSSKPSEQTSK